MMNDWRDVYGQEKRRPGYVIENGKSPAKVVTNGLQRREVTIPQRDKGKAA